MTIKCHFDGSVFVPDEPVNLPVGANLNLSVQPNENGAGAVLMRQGGGTVADVISSGAIGGWAHRTDITDGRAFVDRLRAERLHRRNAL